MAPALLLLALAFGEPARDTTFIVPEGARIAIALREGDVHVTGVEGREARILMEGEEAGVRVASGGGVIHIGARERGSDADLSVWLPRDVHLTVTGREGDITVAGLVRGDVLASTADGDVEIDGAARVNVSALDGDVRLANTGPASVNVADGDVWIDRATGEVTVNGIDADIVVTNADVRALSMSAVDGDLWYDGTVYEGGSYSFSTHDGDVTFALPEGSGASISVSTFDGELIPSFPVQFRGGRLRAGEFTVGDGSAAVTLRSFDGDILLIRPGERTPDLDEERE
ncbi:DUF4097 family beta strand repeat-containing protein [Candidatus Palauibacter sp.]|uniref:DUF4097 family beta strand repeat-containing protein n=1 Tax=Candidatus Palauibacter sp. TaxID=3101350 RepID=UPI003AF286BF